MKKQFTSRSAFFNPRVLIGFVLCSIGVLLALTGSSESVTGNPAATSAETQNALFSLTAGTDNTAIGASALFRGQRATTRDRDREPAAGRGPHLRQDRARVDRVREPVGK